MRQLLFETWRDQSWLRCRSATVCLWFIQTFLLHPRMLFLSRLSLVLFLGGLGRACLVYVRKRLFFSAAGLPQWALKLQIYKCSTLTGTKHTKLGTKSNTCCTEGFSEMSYEWNTFCSTYDRRSPRWKKWEEKIAWRQRQAWLTTIFL